MKKESFLSIIATLQEEFQTTFSLTEKSAPRDYAFPDVKDAIKVAVGMRRSGKTYFLFQTIRKLIETGLPKELFLYINFEDNRLFIKL